jgi:hypothetical protein
MDTEQILDINLETEAHPDDMEIVVSVEYDIENDGIGSYEYWGHKCCDKGTDCIVIQSWDWDRKGFSPGEIEVVEANIEAELPRWEEKIAEEISDDGDYDDYRDDD